MFTQIPSQELIMIGRIALATILGLFIGLERERHSRAAGLRTCMMVAMAGALVMSLSIYLGTSFSPFGEESVFRIDPARLPSYALAGMGFLGAGAIIQGKRSAIGITTAAAMWTCTGVGLAVGAGLYLPSIAAVLLTILALTIMRRLELLITRSQFVTLTVETEGTDPDDLIHELFKEYKANLNFTGRERCLESNRVIFTYSLAITSGRKWQGMLKSLEEMPKVLCYSWQQSEVP